MQLSSRPENLKAVMCGSLYVLVIVKLHIFLLHDLIYVIILINSGY